jgi:hypothetical protein
MRACPYRAEFYKKLGDDQAKVDKQMTAWLDALEKIVEDMRSVYASNAKAYGGQV